MIDPWMMRGAIIVAALCVASCAGGPQAEPPEASAAAYKHSEAAREAFAAGRHDDAIREYGAALTLHHSVEDPVGVSRNLLNLAIVSDAAGRDKDAGTFLAAMDRHRATLAATTPRDLASPEMRELLGEAAWLRARRCFDAGDTAGALSLLAAARAEGGNSTPALNGRCNNLEAKIRERQGDGAAAKRLAERAAADNHRAGDKVEEATSWRIFGRAAVACGQPAEAEQAFERALALDRASASAQGVASDLDGLAQAAALSGQTERSRTFAFRARQARQAQQAGAKGVEKETTD